MSDKKQPSTRPNNPWFYVAETVALGLAIAAGGLFLEYFVFNPGDVSSQQERHARLWGLSPWAGGIVVVIVLITSAIREDGKAWWRRRWHGLIGLRPRLPYTTAKQRLAGARRIATDRSDLKRQKYEEGFAARSAEVAAERAEVKPPFWSFRRIDEAERGEFILYNKGWMVGNVFLDAPEDEFIFDGDPPVFKGEFGSDQDGVSSGKRFYGRPTQKGAAEGVTFTVEWSDRNLDRHKRSVHVEPNDLGSPDEHKARL